MKVPAGIPPIVLGKEENHAALHDVLANYEYGKFWVTNKTYEEELAQVRRVFRPDDEELQGEVLYHLLDDGDHQKEFRLLLSLGIHPDLFECEGNYRLSHWTTFYGRRACAHALSHCRPDILASNKKGETPSTVSVSSSQSLLQPLLLLSTS